MRILSLLFIMLMVATVGSADTTFSGQWSLGNLTINSDQADTYSDITFYHNCDALGDATKSVGSATVSYGGSILLETTSPIVGTGSWDNNNAVSNRIHIAVADNINTGGDFRIGMYIVFKEHQQTETHNLVNGSSTYYPMLNPEWGSSNYHRMYLYGTTAHSAKTAPTLDTAYFWEYAYDSTANTAYVYVDGVLYQQLSGGANAWSDDTFVTFRLGAESSGSITDQWYDQIIISNDKDRDIYAIRNVTDFN